MHLLIPFAAGASPAAAEAASHLDLPHLERLLARLDLAHEDTGDELSLNTPHERAQGAAWGWTADDGLLPLAAQRARADGLAPGAGEGWGLLSPTHWHLGTEQVSMLDPEGLALDGDEARTLFASLQPLFADEGWQLHWGAATRWYLVHDDLARLPTASLDRVVGRNVDLWLTSHALAGRMRRLQAEAQMLLHTHPLNAAREAAGRQPVNSFWLSGTGVARPAPAADTLQTDDRLRAPALAEDWARWAEAWAALDAGPLNALLARAEAGEPVQLSLAGERTTRRYASRPRPLWRRWLAPGRVPAGDHLRCL
jgi:hypothetical protein